MKRAAGSGRAAAAVRSVNYASSPLLASKTPAWRSKFVVALIGLGSCVLLARAAYVQLIGAEFYQAQGEKRFAHTLVLHGSRGRILDRDGQLLAISVEAPSIWAIPRDLAPERARRQQLAAALGMTLAELERRLADNPNFVWLRRQVEDATAARVRALALRGVHQTREHRRRYPEGEAAAHVVGFTDVEQRGQEGVELAFEPRLRGRDGSRDVIRDRLGRIVEDFGNQIAPVHGADVVLSIDAKVQALAFRAIRDAVAEHRAKAASAVVLDARSGEVLALANWPSFDPSVRSGERRARWAPETLRNRALTDTFEPGSTLKPFSVAAALEAGLVQPESRIPTAPGRIVVGGRTISDTRPHDLLTVEQVVAKSSNVGTVRIALDLPAERLWNVLTAAGFGQAPAARTLGFQGAVAGRLRPYRSWRPIEQATIAYGYGVSVSLLQLARAYTAFARDGDVVPISLTRLETAPAGVPVIRPETARAMRRMLEQAVGDEGTAPQARIAGWRVAGKTGTARKLRDGQYVNAYVASFAGLAPASDPRIVVAVMIDEPGGSRFHGGEVAAPVFAQIAAGSLRTLQVPPDGPPAPAPRVVALAAEAL